MGVQLGNIVPVKQVSLEQLTGKKIAIDAYNNLYQYLSIIRDRITGEPLKDRKGRITSHLSGLLYRTTNLIEIGIKPIFVFDGEPPKFKRTVIEAREEAKKEAEKKWKEALKKGEEAITYAQAASRLTDEMIDDAKKLLTYMGIPWIQAPSEGEAQCAFIVKKGDADLSASQDYDSLLFGSPRLVRNISITGRRKLPRKETYIEIKPEIIELRDVLSSLDITYDQLIIVGILIGTDYNPGGIEKVGPKRSLQLVRENKSLENILEKVEWKFDVSAKEIFNFFKNPPVTKKYDIKWKEPNSEKIFEFMVDEHDFSSERVEKVVKKLQESFTKGKQTTLGGWLK
jgi:flap endonuclease-1